MPYVYSLKEIECTYQHVNMSTSACRLMFTVESKKINLNPRFIIQLEIIIKSCGQGILTREGFMAEFLWISMFIQDAWVAEINKNFPKRSCGGMGTFFPFN